MWEGKPSKIKSFLIDYQGALRNKLENIVNRSLVGHAASFKDKVDLLGLPVAQDVENFIEDVLALWRFRLVAARVPLRDQKAPFTHACRVPAEFVKQLLRNGSRAELARWTRKSLRRATVRQKRHGWRRAGE